jgi:hypothetical protein
MSRVCLCARCSESEAADLALGVSGDACANCWFFSGEFRHLHADGICRKFELIQEKNGMNLYHRKLGRAREGAHALVVGGAFSCGFFRPFHDEPAPESPLGQFWAEEGSDR